MDQLEQKTSKSASRAHAAALHTARIASVCMALLALALLIYALLYRGLHTSVNKDTEEVQLCNVELSPSSKEQGILIHDEKPYYVMAQITVDQRIAEERIGFTNSPKKYTEEGLYEVSEGDCFNMAEDTRYYAIKNKSAAIGCDSVWDYQYQLAVEDIQTYTRLYDIEFYDFTTYLYELFPYVMQADMATRTVIQPESTASLRRLDEEWDPDYDANCALRVSTNSLNFTYAARMDTQNHCLYIYDVLNEKTWIMDIQEDSSNNPS